MIVLLREGASPEDLQQVLDVLHELGLEGTGLPAGGRLSVHVRTRPAWSARRLRELPQVAALLSCRSPRAAREGIPFFPYHFISWTVLLLMVLSGLTLLAGFFPPGLGHPGDPLAIPPGPGTVAWYFRPITSFLDLFPEGWQSLGSVLLLLIFALFFFLPSLDRTRGPALRQRLPIVLVGLLILFVGLLFSLGGLLG